MKKYFLKTFLLSVTCQVISVCCLNAQIGTWSKIASDAPHSANGVLLLLTDGTVLCNNSSGGGYGAGWDRLTPDIHGSYINGTWSSIADMHHDRDAFASQILPNGNVFVAGGEYGSGDTAGEVYNPLTNVWTICNGMPTNGVESYHTWNVYDAPSELLYNGTVLLGPELGATPSLDCLFYTPSDNLFSVAPSAIYDHDEAEWLKLPDSSVLFVGIASRNSNRYIPQTNRWINDASLPVSIFDPYGEESGCAMMLPNGKAIFFGATQYNAFYTPTGNTSPGTWTAAAEFPMIGGTYVAQVDAPGDMMVNGHILLTVSPVGTSANDEFRSPTYFLEYDYTTNSFTQVTSTLPGIGTDSLAHALCQFMDFINLPDGTVLYCNTNFGYDNSQYWVYTPGSGPIPQGKPTINSIIPDGCPNYKVTGKLFNGISEGSAYGDDLQNATNYPLVRLSNGTDVYYARTTNWNRIGAVQTDSLEDTAVFTLPTIPAGTYSLVVVVNGFASNPVLFSKLEISNVTEADISCSGTTGSATVGVSGGLLPYTYLWSGTSQTTSAISGLSAGTYSITVRDNNDCTVTASVTITQPANIMRVNAMVTANANCRITGSDSAYASGGTSPYTYMWSDANTQTTVTATGLSAGTYTVTVTDHSGCSGTASNIITQPVVLNITAGIITNVSCNAGSNGSESVSVSGGTAPYTYLWNDANSQTAATASGLSAGTYLVLVTDNNGCYETLSSTITQPALPVVSANIVADVSCHGLSNGILSASVSGGTLPYTYLWNDVSSQTTLTASGLSAGTYTVTVTDSCGASATASGSIVQPSLPTVYAYVVAGVSCNGESNGSAWSYPFGGTTPYSYLWNNAGSETTANVSGLSTGTYTVTVFDPCGNSVTASVTITQPTILTVTIDSTNVTPGDSCNGAATVHPTGGTGPYNYLWTPGNQRTSEITGKCAGTYCCRIIDANGCTESVCTTVSTGINNIVAPTEKITIYPNPNQGQFMIKSSAVSEQWSVEIYDVLGEKVYSKLCIVNSQLLINLNEQPSGIYFYRVINEVEGNLIGEGKIIIEK